MTSDRDFGVLQEKVARLESWRSRIVEVLPIAFVTAVLIWVLSTLFGMQGQLARIDEHLNGIDGRLSRLETRIDAGFADMVRRLDAMEHKQP